MKRDALTDEIHRVEVWLEKRTKQSRAMKLLMGMPGIGRFSAALTLAEIGDIGFFKNKRKLSSFVGVVHGARNLDRSHRDTALKKDSNRYVRWLLAEAVPKGVRAWKRLYERVHAGNPRRRSKAKVAVMHKIVGAIWRVLKTKEPSERLHSCAELRALTASPPLGTGLR